MVGLIFPLNSHWIEEHFLFLSEFLKVLFKEEPAPIESTLQTDHSLIASMPIPGKLQAAMPPADRSGNSAANADAFIPRHWPPSAAIRQHDGGPEAAVWNMERVMGIEPTLAVGWEGGLAATLPPKNRT